MTEPGPFRTPSSGDVVRGYMLRGKGSADDVRRMEELLGQADRLRADGLLPEAEEAYKRAFGIAARLAMLPQQAMAARGIALAAQSDDRPRKALEWFDGALSIAAATDWPEWIWEVQLDRATVLTRIDPDRARSSLQTLVPESAPTPILRRRLTRAFALASVTYDPRGAAQIARTAFDDSRAANAEHECYEALLILSAALRNAGDRVGAANAFRDAYDLALRLARLNVDHAAYLGHPARRRERADEVRRRARQVWGADSEQGLAVLQTMTDQACARVGRNQIRDAVPVLEECRKLWLDVGALYEAGTVDYFLGVAFSYAGQVDRALNHLGTARYLGEKLAWANLEGLACGALATLLNDNRTDASIDTLELAATARALDEARDAEAKSFLADGALERTEAKVAQQFAADDLIDELLNTAVDKARAESDQMLAAALGHLLDVRIHRAQPTAAAAIAAELTAMEPTDVASRYSRGLGIGRWLIASGDHSEQTLEHLIATCDIYEELRHYALGTGSLDQLRRIFAPPLDQAAELAVELGQPDVAVTMLGRSKARVLLDLLAISLSHQGREGGWRPLSATECRDALRLGPNPPVLADFLVGERAVYVLVIDPETDVAVSHRLYATNDSAWIDFLSALSRGSPRTALHHPVRLALSASLDRLASSRPLRIVPHGPLHGLPLHLIKAGALHVPRPDTHVVPTTALLRHAPSSWVPTGRAIVGGDPTHDLPHARWEAAHVARQFGVRPALGSDVTLDWLRRELEEASGEVALVHLACHGVFERKRPERSGLVLAGAGTMPWERADIATLPQLAELPWAGALVVLSACNTGLGAGGVGDEIAGLSRTLLAAGARALVVSLWDVADQPAALVMSEFYEDLRRHDTWSVGTIAESLRTAQCAVRDMSIQSAEGAARVLGLRDARPPNGAMSGGYGLDDPWQWGAFVVMGAG